MKKNQKLQIVPACGGLLAPPFLLFWPVWWPDPAQQLRFDYGDYTEQHFSMRRLGAGYRAGRLPSGRRTLSAASRRRKASKVQKMSANFSP